MHNEKENQGKKFSKPLKLLPLKEQQNIINQIRTEIGIHPQSGIRGNYGLINFRKLARKLAKQYKISAQSGFEIIYRMVKEKKIFVINQYGKKKELSFTVYIPPKGEKGMEALSGDKKVLEPVL
jgi:hypothetical protein